MVGLCAVREQIITDEASGLTFQFELEHDGCTRLRVFGDALPFQIRQFIFDRAGACAATGTVVRGRSKPTWRIRLDRDGRP